MALKLVATLCLAAARASASAVFGQRGQAFLGNGMQPEMVARTLASVEDEWKAHAAVFAECDSTAGLPGATIVNCADAPGSFAKSCGTVVSAIVQGSGGDRKVTEEYMNDVCGQRSISGWHQQQCQSLALTVRNTMTADKYENRESFDTGKLCSAFWSRFLADEKQQAAKEKAVRAEADKKAAEEAAEEERLHAEELKKKDEQKKAEQSEHEKTEAAAKAAEAKAKAAEAAARLTEKKAEAAAVAETAKQKMAEAQAAELESKKAMDGAAALKAVATSEAKAQQKEAKTQQVKAEKPEALPEASGTAAAATADGNKKVVAATATEDKAASPEKAEPVKAKIVAAAANVNKGAATAVAKAAKPDVATLPKGAPTKA